MASPRRYTPAQRALVDQVRHILRYSPGNKLHVALTLRVDPAVMVKRLQRAGRQDLVQRMARWNAADPGWHCGMRSCPQCGDPARARRARRAS